MGRYVNPGNEGFSRILRERYVDKTGLITLFDATLDTVDGLVMVSRPRWFGKSFAAQSLVAFYSCGCDSRALFEGLDVSRRGGWDAHLNAYNVVQLDMTSFIEAAGGARDVVQTVSKLLLGELREIAEDAGNRAAGRGDELKAALLDVVRAALLSAADHWARVEELPSGRGFADVAYLPKRGSGRPALLVELKWDKPVRAAIDQIRANDYPAVLRGLSVPILLVGVTYSSKTKEHSCRIELLKP